MSAYSHSHKDTDTENYSDATVNNRESSRQSSVRLTTAHAMIRPAPTVLDVPNIPMSFADLKNKPIINAKCLSTLWKNC